MTLEFNMTDIGKEMKHCDDSALKWLQKWLPRYVDYSNELAKHIANEREDAKKSNNDKQHTCCAFCGEDKHTRIRCDRLGGYIFLTCIDKELHKE